VTPGYELILFLETDDGALRMDPSGWIRARKLLMHHTGWVAGRLLRRGDTDTRLAATLT
jgi:hypothetical protein